MFASFRPFAVLAVLLAALPLSSAAQQTQRQWFAGGPNPLRYEIAVSPDADAGAFAGEARIRIETSEPLAAVEMNALGLEVSSARIDGAAAAFAVNADAQTLTLTPRRPLRPGRHTLHIVYRGAIQDDAYGLFRVSYQDGETTKRALATQFEPGDARRFAPMWDQPNRRAVFSLTVTAPSDQMVVSNMPVASAAQLRDGLTRTRFADTPSMPSYLLFLAVGDFERITRNVDGVELGVVVRRGETHRARYALEAGEESLRYFTEYFGIRYPLPKLDMIGVPGAGGFGAMENWGAILYFDQYLLMDEDRSSETERQNVFSIIAHEIAHQWFGNLVTMTWWDDLWLNEGFASWMAAKAIEARHPDWDPWLAQMIDGTSTAMALDAREGTHAVVQPVNTLDEANLAFDTITYEKGLAVIRMLEGYVGEEDFRSGVRNYLNSRLYGNARTEDLWAAVQAASGQPVLDIARSFTGQPGFPLVQARCQEGGGRATIALTQRRFAMDAAARTAERWAIPITVRVGAGAAQRFVVAPQAEQLIEAGGACGAYVVNAGQSGFFRVLYDRANLARLTRAFADLDDADQLGLLLDYWAFGRSGDAPFTDYLELVNAIPDDANPLIVMDTVAAMGALAAYARGRPSEAAVKAYGLRTLRPHFARVGWEPRTGEGSNQARMRAALISALGALGDEAVIAEARRRVRAASSDPGMLPAAIRTATLGVYAHNASAADYEALVAQARATDDFVERRRLWLLAASAADATLAQRSLQRTLGEDIPRQIRTQVLTAVAGEHPRMAWDFLVANRTAVEALLDPLQRLEFPTEIAAASTDPSVAAELETYAHSFPAGARPTVAAASAAIRLRAQTVAERMPAVEAWIATQSRGVERGR
jgi:aminopeptidase N